jgi:superfamily II DNA or RNA helicase
MITLHPFQQTVVDQIEKAIEQGQRKLLLVAPTGSGKTVMGSAIINCRRTPSAGSRDRSPARDRYTDP